MSTYDIITICILILRNEETQVASVETVRAFVKCLSMIEEFKKKEWYNTN